MPLLERAMVSAQDDAAVFRHQVARIREAGALGKSGLLARLFDFLVETSLAGRSPKEVEVAHAVFARGGTFDAAQDASVRVYVHRLRRKLEQFYAGPGACEAVRVIIPRGEYRLVVEPADVPAAGAVDTGRASSLWQGRPRRLAIGVAVLLLAGLLAAAVAPLLAPEGHDFDLQAVRDAPLWAPTIRSARPIVVVIGDYYIFGEADRHGRVQRLIREYAINSRYDLDQHVMRHPELYGRYVDLGLSYYPISIADALRNILPILHTAGRRKDQVRVIPASDLTPEVLRVSNVVYIGYLSALKTLRNPVFNGGSYAIGSTYDELIDKRTGRSFTATSASGGSGPQRDFGYISRFMGPGGTSIVVIAGTRDAAVMQAAEFASTLGSLKQMDVAAGGREAYDALLRVDTMGNENLGGRLLAVQPLNRAMIWRADAQQHFPDDETSDDSGDGH